MSTERTLPRKSRRWVAWLAVIAIGGVAGASVLRRTASAHEESGMVATVERGNVTLAIEEIGSVEPFRKVELKSKMAGQVAAVLVDVGSVVHAGDVLVRLDPRDVVRELREAEAKRGVDQAIVVQARASLDMQLRALGNGGVSAFDVAHSRGDLARATAQVAVDRAGETIMHDRVDYTELRAPIDGVVLARNVQPGEMVTPGVAAMVDGKPLLVVAQVEKLLVRTELNQVDVVRLSLDQPVSVHVDAVPGLVLRGAVYRIAAMAQKSERRRDSNLMVFAVDVLVDGAQAGATALRPGMLAEVSVALPARENVLTVPLEAVVRENGKTKLRQLDQANRETLVAVELGAENEHVVEILSGIEAGARVRIRAADASK